MAADLPDYYAILQVPPNAQQEVIEAAYRRLAKIYHPDVNPSPDANQKMSVLNQAYAILSDSAARAHYDGLRREPSLEEEPVAADQSWRRSRREPSLEVEWDKKEQAQKDILWGSVWFFGGAIVTAGTYMLASQEGGRYFITWGAVIFGGYRLLKGLSELYSAVGWKGSKGAVLTVAVITLILGGIGVVTLNEKAPGGTLSGGGGSTPTRSSQSTERSTLSVQIDSNKLKLAALNRDVDSYDVTLNGLQARLDSIKRRYPTLVLPEPGYSQYKQITNEYNSTVAERNALVDDYERLRITTNRLVDRYNTLR